MTKTSAPIRRDSPVGRSVTWLLIVIVLLGPNAGCSRKFWRHQAEKDTYDATVERLNDPRWQLPRIDITPDSRSRFFDPYDPDRAPLPPDDPAAHQYMHCVDGWKGYKSWHKLGQSFSIENPQWLEQHGVHLDGSSMVDPVAAHHAVQLTSVTLQSSLELSYIHSRDYQTQIENLYLSALALTLERFRFSVRYLTAAGREPGADGTIDVLPGPNAAGFPGRLDNAGLSSRFGIRQMLPSGAQWAVELANNTIWILGSGGPTGTASTLSYSLVQPLMFGAGRKVVLADLTQSEREVLYSARDLARFRKTFFSATTSAYLDILRQRQLVLNEMSNIARLQEQIEYRSALDTRPVKWITEDLKTLPADVMIPAGLRGKLSYNKDNQDLRWDGPMSSAQQRELLSLSDDDDFQRAAREIIQRMNTDVRGLPAAQLINQLLSSQSRLRNFERTLQDQLDTFKIQIGMPTNIQFTVDEALLKPFELISPRVAAIEGEIKKSVDDFAGISLTDPDSKEIAAALAKFRKLLTRFETEGLGLVRADITPVESLLKATADDWTAAPEDGRSFQTDAERDRVKRDVERDRALLEIGQAEFEGIVEQTELLMTLVEAVDDPAKAKSLDTDHDGKISAEELPERWRDSYKRKVDSNDDEVISRTELLRAVLRMAQEQREVLLRLSQGLQSVQTGLRVETVTVNEFKLPWCKGTPTVDEVVEIGLENRLDLMNARATVMDARRAVEVAANALEAAVDVVAAGDINTPPIGPGVTRPFDFRANRSSFRAGLRFTAPLDQVAERNAYNRALIDYQRARRFYIETEDQVKFQIRQSWRQLEVQKVRIEFDRQTVRNAALQYDSAALEASRSSESAFNLLNALSSILTAQNSLIQDWVTYEQNRIQIFRDMGIMEIDPQGIWIDNFYSSAGNSGYDAFGSDGSSLPGVYPADDHPANNGNGLPPSPEEPPWLENVLPDSATDNFGTGSDEENLPVNLRNPLPEAVSAALHEANHDDNTASLSTVAFRTIDPLDPVSADTGGSSAAVRDSDHARHDSGNAAVGWFQRLRGIHYRSREEGTVSDHRDGTRTAR